MAACGDENAVPLSTNNMSEERGLKRPREASQEVLEGAPQAKRARSLGPWVAEAFSRLRTAVRLGAAKLRADDQPPLVKAQCRIVPVVAPAVAHVKHQTTAILEKFAALRKLHVDTQISRSIAATVDDAPVDLSPDAGPTENVSDEVPAATLLHVLSEDAHKDQDTKGAVEMDVHEEETSMPVTEQVVLTSITGEEDQSAVYTAASDDDSDVNVVQHVATPEPEPLPVATSESEPLPEVAEETEYMVHDDTMEALPGAPASLQHEEDALQDTVQDTDEAVAANLCQLLLEADREACSQDVQETPAVPSLTEHINSEQEQVDIPSDEFEQAICEEDVEQADGCVAASDDDSDAVQQAATSEPVAEETCYIAEHNYDEPMEAQAMGDMPSEEEMSEQINEADAWPEDETTQIVPGVQQQWTGQLTEDLSFL